MIKRTKLCYLNLILSTLVLCHCGKNPRPSKATPPSPPPPPSTSTPIPSSQPPVRIPELPSNSPVTLSLLPQPQPNLYFVNLSWQQNFNERKLWFVSRTESRSQKVVVYTVPAGKRTFTDENLEANQSYVYSIGMVENSEFKELDRQSVKIPLDLLVTSETTLTKIRGYNRVFLSKTAMIHTAGEALEIDTTELISESGATIEPFNHNIPTPMGQNGKDGALISIKAFKATGALQIYARGMDGGQGLKGAMGAQGSKGNKGADCNPKAPDGKQHAMGGEMGGQGYPGQQGLRGGAGGKNSEIHIEVLLADNFQLNLDQTQAKGGNGGEAGNGGLGGEGGEPGNAPNDPYGMCHWKSAPRGPQGANGPNGQMGPSGVDGQKNTVCLKMSGRTEGTCTR